MKKPDYVAVALCRTHNWTAILIHIGMFLYAILRFKMPKKSYNHDELRYGKLTSGAIAEGVKTRSWPLYVAEHYGKYFRHFDYPLSLTDEEWNKGYAYLKKSEGTKYEYSNFLWHAIRIFFGKWHGSQTSKKLFCLEHVARFLIATGKYDLDPYMSPYEFECWCDSNLT